MKSVNHLHVCLNDSLPPRVDFCPNRTEVRLGADPPYRGLRLHGSSAPKADTLALRDNEPQSLARFVVLQQTDERVRRRRRYTP
jgi:hypothetical protein